MKTFLPITFLLSISILCFSACEKEGPAERTGKKIDKAVEDAQDDLEQAKEDLEKNAKR